jgi:hypothetical protein
LLDLNVVKFVWNALACVQIRGRRVPSNKLDSIVRGRPRSFHCERIIRRVPGADVNDLASPDVIGGLLKRFPGIIDAAIIRIVVT